MNLQSVQDHRFPGRGRTLGSNRNQAASNTNSNSSLQARLLDNSNFDHPSEMAEAGTGQRISDGRYLMVPLRILLDIPNSLMS